MFCKIASRNSEAELPPGGGAVAEGEADAPSGLALGARSPTGATAGLVEPWEAFLEGDSSGRSSG
ncbi:MAG: hypothetical protein ACLPVW_15110 [Terriglobales bacterium]